MSIWKRTFTLAELNASSINTLVEHLGIRYTAFDAQSLTGEMAVNQQTVQPLGLLHGGASVALAETLGSMAGNLCVDQHSYCVGLSIQSNHLAAVKQGQVTAHATPLHLGKTTQVWQIKITDEQSKLINISQLTLMVCRKKNSNSL